MLRWKTKGFLEWRISLVKGPEVACISKNGIRETSKCDWTPWVTRKNQTLFYHSWHIRWHHATQNRVEKKQWKLYLSVLLLLLLLIIIIIIAIICFWSTAALDITFAALETWLKFASLTCTVTKVWRHFCIVSKNMVESGGEGILDSCCIFWGNESKPTIKWEKSRA